MSQDVIAELAPTGVLRAGINMSNFLLVTGKSANGDPDGVSPDMARELAAPPRRASQATCPFKIAGRAGRRGRQRRLGHRQLIGAEPARAEKIAFTAAYCRDRGDLSRAGRLALKSDRRGRPRRRAHRRDGAQRLRPLARPQHQARRAGALRHARQRRRAVRRRQARRAGRPAAAAARRTSRSCRAPASSTASSPPCSRPSARPRKNTAGAAFLRAFVEEAKASGLVARLIERHKVRGLSVAPPG